MSEKRLAVRDCPNCDIEWDGAPDAKARAIVYFCPLHASAEEMLKTLEFLQKWIHEQFCPMADNPDNHMRMCNQARAALKAVGVEVGG